MAMEWVTRRPALDGARDPHERHRPGADEAEMERRASGAGNGCGTPRVAPRECVPLNPNQMLLYRRRSTNAVPCKRRQALAAASTPRSTNGSTSTTVM